MINYAFANIKAAKFYNSEWKRATPLSAGLDLIACQIEQNPKMATVRLGICVAIPFWAVGLLTLRSGFASDTGLSLVNSVGIIDPDYRGELIAKIKGFVPPAYIGARIAQLVITPCDTTAPVLCDELPPTERGDGGFGSTGQ